MTVRSERARGQNPRPDAPLQASRIVSEDGEVLRDATVVRASWSDPDDTDTLRREPRQIVGFRRYDAMAALHRQNPQLWTEDHVEAVVRFRRDYEVGILGAAAAGGRGMTNAKSPDGSMVARMDAATAYREAMDALGLSAGWLVRRLALENWTLSDLAAHGATTAKRMSGRVEAALTRLAEHYGLGERS